MVSILDTLSESLQNNHHVLHVVEIFNKLVYFTNQSIPLYSISDYTTPYLGELYMLSFRYTHTYNSYLIADHQVEQMYRTVQSQSMCEAVSC